MGNKIIILGEVGLGGEIRQVSRLEQRLNEAERLAFKKPLFRKATLFQKKSA
jgi:DNA repair protein RadA/Sms